MQTSDFTPAPGFEWFPVQFRPDGWFHLSPSGATDPHGAHCVLDAGGTVMSIWPDGGDDLAAFRGTVESVREWYRANPGVTCPFVWGAE